MVTYDIIVINEKLLLSKNKKLNNKIKLLVVET